MENNALPKAQTLGEWAYLAVEKHFHKTIKYESDVIGDRDPENLHQMRVGIRRLRSAMDGFAPALNLPKATQDKKVAKIGQILGELRDLDVLREALEEKYRPNLPKSEQKSLDKVLNRLAKQRQQTLLQVQSLLNSPLYQEFKQAWEKWLHQPKYQVMAEFPIGDLLPSLLLPLISRWLLHPAWLIGIEVKAGEIEFLTELGRDGVEDILTAQGEILHSLRKQTKRSRYQLELFIESYDAHYAEIVQDFKAIQTILGDIQDSEVLGAFVTNIFQSATKSKLPTLMNQLAETRYQSWQEWQVFHQKYLQPATKQNLLQTIIQPQNN
jgi:CHAD domain-containing protein